MTSVTITVGGNVVSNDVIDVDTWRTKVTGIGTCRLRIDNSADAWGNTFLPNDAISIMLGVDLIWAGFVDDVKPYLDKRGVLTNELIVTGRDYGRYLTDFYLTKNYVTQLSGAIIDDYLASLVPADPLGYADPGGTPPLKYNCIRTYLGDALREISDQTGWDWYIDNAGTLHYFLAGSLDSTVDLICRPPPNHANNNLLSFEEYEQVGFDIKNYIEIHAGSVKDHWTEENAADYGVIAGAGNINDETAALYMYGVASIEIVDDANDITVGMDFSGAGLYSHVTLDMTKYGQAKVVFRPENGSLGNFHFRPVLIDGGANQITFTRRAEGKSSKGFTEDQNGAREVWHPLSFPIGEHDENPIRATQTSGFWHGDVAFDWSDVEYVCFQLVTTVNMDTVYFDALYLPSVEALSISEDAGGGSSQALYGKRMHTEYRKELKSQIELDAYSAKVLELKKDPLQKFKAVSYGEGNARYPAQIVEVRADDYGIGALTDYIIIRLHHSLHNNRDTRGWDWITEYDLVTSGTEAIRVIRDENYMEALLLELRRLNRGHKGAMEDDEYWLGEIETGITPQIERGATFPLDMRDGDEFFLTADLTVGGSEYYGPALYKYDSAAGDWVRNPIVMHRAADPAAGGEVIGDTLHRTDTGMWYRWTGVWTPITISGGSLVKGMQPFDSAIFFEAIRAYATNANSFNVDINDATDPGKARITGPNGTFSDFAAGDELIIQNAEDPDNNTVARTVDTVDPANDAWIKLDNVLLGVDTATDEQIIVSVMDAIKWTGAAPAIWFADGGNQNTNNGSAHGLPAGCNWIYFTVAAAGLTATNTYANAVGDTVGVVCRLEIYADDEPLIFPFYTRGANMSGDALAYGSVDTLILTGEEIYGKHFATAYNVGNAGGPAGVRFDSSGVYGYSGGVNLEFYLRSLDGKAYFAGGTAYIDSTGVHLLSNAYDFMHFKNAGGNELARISTSLAGAGFYIWPGAGQLADMYFGAPAAEGIRVYTRAAGANYGRVSIYSSNGEIIYLAPADTVTFSGDAIPLGSNNYDLGNATNWWEEGYIDELTVGNAVDSGFLTIPRYNGADPGAPVTGDIWLRTDL